MGVDADRDGFRPAPDALLAEDLLALHAHARHEHTRMWPKKWMGLGIAAETANGNSNANARGRTTGRICAAKAASYQGCVVRGVAVLPTPWRPALPFGSLLSPTPPAIVGGLVVEQVPDIGLREAVELAAIHWDGDGGLHLA